MSLFEDHKLNKLFFKSALQKAAEFSGVVGEFRCHSLHR
jgi:hypothetical protein